MLQLLSGDAGNTVSKFVTTKRTATFPSVSAIEQGALKFDGLAATNNELLLKFDGENIAVGDAAYKYGRMQVSERGSQRVGTHTFRRLIAGGLVSVFPKSVKDFAAVFSLPVDFYTSRRDELREQLSGMYEIGYRGKTLRYKVQEENLNIIPEGFGSLCLLLLDEEGGVVDGSLVRQTVAVVDFGGRTTDFLMFKNLEFIPTASFGRDKVGVATLWRFLSEQITQKYHRNLTDPELDAALHSGFFWDGPDQVSLAGEIDTACGLVADAIIDAINTEWDGGKAAQRIIFTGGGSPLIGPYMPYKHSTYINRQQHGIEPFMGNAVGAYRFGLMRGWGE